MRRLRVAILVLGATCLPACKPEDAVPAKAAAAPRAQSDPHIYRFQCQELSVAATYSTDGTAHVLVGDRTLKLRQAISASGARYRDDAGNEFWTNRVHARDARSAAASLGIGQDPILSGESADAQIPGARP